MTCTSAVSIYADPVRCTRGLACGVALQYLRMLSLACLLVLLLPSNATATAKSGDAFEAVEAMRRDLDAQLQSYEKRTSAQDDAKERVNLKREIEDMRADVAANAYGVSQRWMLTILVAMFLAFCGTATWFLREARRRYFQTADELKTIVDELRLASGQGKRDAEAISEMLLEAEETVRSWDAPQPVTATADLRDDDDKVASSATVEAAAVVTNSAMATQAQKNYALGVTKLLDNQLEHAATLFAAVIVETPHDHEALNSWGVALGRLADAAQGAEERRLRQEAINKYSEAVKHKPDDHKALNNWGAALGRLADGAKGEEQRRLRQEAIVKFAEAVKYSSVYHKAFNNWGVALGRLADAAQGEEQKRLRLEAMEKYATAVKRKPDYHEALYNWGVALGRLADTSQDHEQELLRREATEKYAAAIKHKPDYVKALDNWAATLMKSLAGAASVEARMQLITKAEELLTRAKQIAGHSSYNSACLAALCGDANRFVDEANETPAKDWPDQRHLRQDNDLRPILGDPAFQAWWYRKYGEKF